MIYCMQLFTLRITPPVTIKTVNHSRSIWRTCALLAIQAHHLITNSEMSHNSLFCSFYYIQDLIIEVNFEDSENILHPFASSSGLWPAANLCTDRPACPREKTEKGPLLRFFLRGGWSVHRLPAGSYILIKGDSWWLNKKDFFISCMENATFVPVTRRSSNIFQLELPKT